jgi:hypothetical protein
MPDLEEFIPARTFLTEETEFDISAETKKVSMSEGHSPLYSVATQEEEEEEEEVIVSYDSDHLFGQGNGEFLDSIFTSPDKKLSPSGFVMMTNDKRGGRKATGQPLIEVIDDCGFAGDRTETRHNALVQSCDMVERLTVTDDVNMDSVE